MARKYKIRLMFVGILLVFMIFISFSYVKYQKFIESTNPLVIVEDGLSINYLQGTRVYLRNDRKTITFSITNNALQEKPYYISLEDIISNQPTIKYDLIEQNGKIKLLQNDVSKEYNNLASMLKIEPNETHFYTLILYEQENLNFTAKLNVQVEEENEEYFANTLLKNNEIKKEPLTQIGATIATQDEGLIEASDDAGTFYYFRGKVENNYVSFANLLWRITKINSDGSIRLILNDYPETMGNFYESNVETIEEKMNLSKNKMYETLNTWYQENLNDYDSHLISNKYCVDNSLFSSETNYVYMGYSRIIEEKTYTSNCLGENYTSRIGLLSADEVLMAGATSQEANNEYYLYIPDKTTSWWTITPSRSDATNITYFEVKTNGQVVAESIGTYFRGMRPVVNLIKKTAVTGTGTSTDPYVLK